MERYNKFDVAKLQSISLSQYELADILFFNLVLNVTLNYFFVMEKAINISFIKYLHNLWCVTYHHTCPI